MSQVLQLLRPLLGGHRRGAGVGQQVDEDLVGGDGEQVVVGVAQDPLHASSLEQRMVRQVVVGRLRQHAALREEEIGGHPHKRQQPHQEKEPACPATDGLS